MLAYNNINNYRRSPCFKKFYSCEKSILRKNLVLPIEKFLSLLLPKNARELQQHLKALLSNDCLPEVKKIKNFKLLPLKVVAVANERSSLTRGSKHSDLTWNLLVFWKTAR